MEKKLYFTDEAANVNIEGIKPIENNGRYAGLYLPRPDVRMKRPEEFENDD